MIDAGPLHHEPASVRPHADETQVWRERAGGEREGRVKRRPQTGRTRTQPWPAVAAVLLAWWCMGGVAGRRRISAVSHEWGD